MEIFFDKYRFMLFFFALALLFEFSQLSSLLVQESGLEGTTCSSRKTSQLDETEREEDDEVQSLGSCVQILQCL